MCYIFPICCIANLYCTRLSCLGFICPYITFVHPQVCVSGLPHPLRGELVRRLLRRLCAQLHGRELHPVGADRFLLPLLRFLHHQVSTVLERSQSV